MSFILSINDTRNVTLNSDYKETLSKSWVKLYVKPSPEVFINETISEGSSDEYHLTIMGYVKIPGKLLNRKEIAKEIVNDWNLKRNPVANLQGSYSGVIINLHTHEVIVFVDILSTRIVFCTQIGQSLYYSSTLQALHKYVTKEISIDYAFIWSYLVNASSIDNHTLFSNIKTMNSGSYHKVIDGQLSKKQYFKHAYKTDNQSIESYSEQLLEILKAVLDDACFNCANPGFLFSGGLDSRLIAANISRNVKAITLADYNNIEVRVATSVAKFLKLDHNIILRDRSFYSRYFEELVSESNCLWSWNQGHFLPLKDKEGFNYDACILGYGSDTYFKGVYFNWTEICNDYTNTNNKEILKKLIINRPVSIEGILKILSEKFKKICQEQYLDAIDNVLNRLMDDEQSIPDLWQLFWTHNMAWGNDSNFNIVSLRNITSERNIFTERRLYEFSLTVPFKFRKDATLISNSLKRSAPVLYNFIPNSNTLLPEVFSSGLHQLSTKLRPKLADLKNKLINKNKSSSSWKTAGSWPNHHLMVQNDASLKDRILKLADESYEIFDSGALKEYIKVNLNSASPGQERTFQPLITLLNYLKLNT